MFVGDAGQVFTFREREDGFVLPDSELKATENTWMGERSIFMHNIRIFYWFVFISFYLSYISIFDSIVLDKVFLSVF